MAGDKSETWPAPLKATFRVKHHGFCLLRMISRKLSYPPSLGQGNTDEDIDAVLDVLPCNGGAIARAVPDAGRVSARRDGFGAQPASGAAGPGANEAVRRLA